MESISTTLLIVKSGQQFYKRNKKDAVSNKESLPLFQTASFIAEIFVHRHFCMDSHLPYRLLVNTEYTLSPLVQVFLYLDITLRKA
jgi:hypothetical protein